MLYTRYSDFISSPQSPFSLSAGKLTCTFTWPAQIQSQYDEVLARVETMRKSDPMIGEDRIVRVYDWLDYYCNQVPAFDVTGWIEKQTMFPQSMRNLDLYGKYNIYQERKTLALGIQQVLAEYKEMLVWQCVVTDSYAETLTCTVRKGAWYNNQSRTWRVGFVFPDDELTYDRIDTLKVIVAEVQDESD